MFTFGNGFPVFAVVLKLVSGSCCAPVRLRCMP